ncbi:ExbD/TolR family protein [Aquisalimonas asiatica]|uniref:Biopolymer transport protein ExbD n=1 Tax=Aquisalimonas asiatica TaxID=406100 RepID=A0A1H8VGY8_9GAMM|nr:biopolymer transporter ExbD [Aquisalimonas asiatica]SEP14590.1 biopolymer transport protein ExbD [Aquisalimonas asiatica]
MHIEYTDRPRRRKPSLTPLIDVVFILLVFFMLASTFTEWRSLELNVPADATAPSEDEAPPLVVRVGDDSVSLDGDTMELATVADAIADAISEDPERVVVVRPEGDVPLQRLVTVMERLNQVDGVRISLQREE